MFVPNEISQERCDRLPGDQGTRKPIQQTGEQMKRIWNANDQEVRAESKQGRRQAWKRVLQKGLQGLHLHVVGRGVDDGW